MLAAALINRHFSHKSALEELNSIKQELEVSRIAFDFSDFLSSWNSVQQEITHLMETSNLDRFLILRAKNGEDTPKYTTAIFQMRQGIQEPFSYVHFELDKDYKDRLLETKSMPYVYVRTEDLPEDAGIKDVYLAEGVTACVWFYLGTKTISEGKAIITYCSFATHSEEGLTEKDITKARLIVGMLKEVGNFLK